MKCACRFLTALISFAIFGQCALEISRCHAAGPSKLKYELVEVFRLPGVDASSGKPSTSTVFDALPDGRVIASDGTVVYVETGAQSRVFSALGKLPKPMSPGFLAVSVTAKNVAIGDASGNSMVIFPANDPTSAKSYAVANFDGAWVDDKFIGVSAASGMGPIVSILDSDSSKNVTVIGNIGGASAGVAFDGNGNLYTADGFEATGPGVGTVKCFLKKDWSAVLTSGGTPLDFSKQGQTVAVLLSGNSLEFDENQNLIVGGGVVFGSGATDENRGYVAIAGAAGISSALGGGPPVVSVSSRESLQKIAPVVRDRGTWFGRTNNCSGELYVTGYGDSLVFVYKNRMP